VFSIGDAPSQRDLLRDLVPVQGPFSQRALLEAEIRQA
jgi:hypothetical protein